MRRGRKDKDRRCREFPLTLKSNGDKIMESNGCDGEKAASGAQRGAYEVEVPCVGRRHDHSRAARDDKRDVCARYSVFLSENSGWNRVLAKAPLTVSGVLFCFIEKI